ncbi:DMT family transporter [Tepidiforma sp.]|jgi:drug/metabolite transporter (DMT)-like permease|uniref:DMT family transporter n=1 Tax=Tepidiforma sp. TaxID=2682230 RepID=UPI00261AB84C|nr:DMT family transporter [Tepidiforma sp.]MCX7617329.1 DMT family transporter [Tepidiforma sp.]
MSSRHLFILFLLSVTWGASFLFIKVQLDAGLEPLAVASLRTLLGAAALAPFAFAAARTVRPTPRQAALLAALGLTNFALPWTLVAVAEHHISSGMASIANATAPLWAAVLAVAFLRDEPLTLQKSLGLAFGFTGIVLLAGPASLAHLSGEALGVSLMLLSTLSYSSSAIVIRRTLGGLPPALVAFGQVAAAAAALAPPALATGGFSGAAWGAGVLGSAAALGVLGSGVAVVLYMGLIQQIGAVRSTLVTYLIPPWGVMFGWAILGEPLGWNLLAGLAVVLAGVLLVQGVIRLPLSRAPSPEGSAAAGR